MLLWLAWQLFNMFRSAASPIISRYAFYGVAALGIVGLLILAALLFAAIFMIVRTVKRWDAAREARFRAQHGHGSNQKFAAQPQVPPVAALPQKAESLERFQQPSQGRANDDPYDAVHQGREQLTLDDLDEDPFGGLPQNVKPMQRGPAQGRKDDGRPFVDSQVGGSNKEDRPVGGKQATEPVPSPSEEEDDIDGLLDDGDEEKEPVAVAQAPKMGFAQRPITSIFKKKEPLGFLDLAEVINDGFMPTAEKILLGVTPEGKLLTERATDLWHIMAGGPSGGGKSTFQRLVQAQLMSIGAQCYMSNIHYNPHDAVAGIHWDILEERLIAPVASEAEETYDLLVGVVAEMEDRRQRTKRGEMKLEDLVPFFVFVEELPGVRLRLDKEKLAILEKSIAIILSEGRKYQICYSGVAQGAVLAMIGGDSGTRSNIMTGVYTGGHPYTGRVLLHLETGKDRKVDPNEVKIDEEAIKGGGMVYVKSLHHSPTLTRIPWVSDRSVEMLFKNPMTVPRRTDRQKAS